MFRIHFNIIHKSMSVIRLMGNVRVEELVPEMSFWVLKDVFWFGNIIWKTSVFLNDRQVQKLLPGVLIDFKLSILFKTVNFRNSVEATNVVHSE